MNFFIIQSTCNRDLSFDFVLSGVGGAFNYYALMGSSLWFDAIHLEWSIVYTEGSQLQLQH